MHKGRRGFPKVGLPTVITMHRASVKLWRHVVAEWGRASVAMLGKEWP